MVTREESAMKTHHNQGGAVLIVFIFVITLAFTAYLLKTYNSSSIAVEQNNKTMQALQQAKEALIAWAVSNSGHLGQLPYPDRNSDGNYDGFSDCGGDPTTNFSLLIGQLPIYGQTAPCVSPQKGLGINVQDAQGNSLWYAVSPNLVHNYTLSSDPVINPSIIDNPTVPWLKVLDSSGNLISDRVAVVIIAPGNAIGGQSRAGAVTVDNYLDSFQKNGNTYSNNDYDSANEDFVIGQDLKQIDMSDATITKPYFFNDQLVYITIDELMVALEKRVGEEVRFRLKTYEDTNGDYPYAAHLGTAMSYTTDGNLVKGFLPVFQSCMLNVGAKTFDCRQPLFDPIVSGISSIRLFFTYPGSFSGFSTSTAGCTILNAGKECMCSGNGACTNTSDTFKFECVEKKCDVTTTPPADAELISAIAKIEIQGGNFTNADGASCSITNSIVTDSLECPIAGSAKVICDSSAGNGSVASYSNSDAALDVPTWFIDNQWQNYVFYHMTRPVNPSGIKVGSKAAEATIITVGRRINSAPFALSKGAAQIPSCNDYRDYLDSVENTNGDSVYDATFTKPSASYNDQSFVVKP
jgi:hypothetical protein